MSQAQASQWEAFFFPFSFFTLGFLTLPRGFPCVFEPATPGCGGVGVEKGFLGEMVAPVQGWVSALAWGAGYSLGRGKPLTFASLSELLELLLLLLSESEEVPWPC